MREGEYEGFPLRFRPLALSFAHLSRSLEQAIDRVDGSGTKSKAVLANLAKEFASINHAIEIFGNQQPGVLSEKDLKTFSIKNSWAM